MLVTYDDGSGQGPVALSGWRKWTIVAAVTVVLAVVLSAIVVLLLGIAVSVGVIMLIGLLIAGVLMPFAWLALRKTQISGRPNPVTIDHGPIAK